MKGDGTTEYFRFLYRYLTKSLTKSLSDGLVRLVEHGNLESSNPLYDFNSSDIWGIGSTRCELHIYKIPSANYYGCWLALL